MLTIGQKAPAFTLPDQDGNPTSLADLRGKWVVLYFYPKDDTPGCTVEACEFTAAMPDFRGLHAEVFGCSADGAAAHEKFIAKHGLGVRLLTDADRTVMKAYGAYGKKVLYGREIEGVLRSTVLVAPDGTVAHHWKSVKAAGHAEHVKNKLRELRGAPATAARATKKKAPAPKAAKKKVAAKPAAASKRAAAKPAAKNVRRKAKA